MTIHFDDKGKFFTEHVTKVPLAVIIRTAENTIRGEVHLRPETRLIDELRHAEQYLAVTAATVYDNAGEELYRVDFFALNLDHVVWIMPVEEVSNAPDFIGEL